MQLNSIGRVSLMTIFVAAISAFSTAHANAEILNLHCPPNAGGGYESVYWIDLGKREITFTVFNIQNQAAIGPPTTVPVRIQPTSFYFESGGSNMTIDRTTGAMVEYITGMQRSQYSTCSVGRTPFPSPPQTKF
jgi:hypothetical protein